MTAVRRHASGPENPDAIGGDFAPPMAGLGENMHGPGALTTTDALIERATGQPRDPKIFEASLLRARYPAEG